MNSTSFRFLHLASTPSTNDEVIGRAKKGELAGLVVTANFQTHGRGREDRAWESKKGQNLLMSILLRPKVKANRVAGLTLVTAQAVREALKSFGITSSIKKPNDLLVEGKKICGILTESSSKGAGVEWCVVGIGLNANSSKEDIPPEATSMRLVSRKEYKIEEVRDKVLAAFKEKYLEWVK